MNNKVWDPYRLGFYAVLLGLGVLSAKLLGLGWLDIWKHAATVIISLGIFSLFEHVFKQDTPRLISNIETKVDTLLEKAKPKGFFSDEGALAHMRKVYYHYHLTHVNDEFVWRRTTIDFTLKQETNRLIADCSWNDPENENELHHYTVEAIPSRDRLILIITAKKGTEQPQIEVYPRVGKEDNSVNAGWAILESPSNKQLGNALCLLTTKAVSEPSQSLPRAGSEKGKYLSQLWWKHFAKSCKMEIVLPKDFEVTYID